jgi:ATP-dependent Clp protease adaptor protein ClpS
MLEAMSQTVELPRTRGPGGDLGGLWRVVVLNDSYNTFDHVAETLARVIPGLGLADGYRMADRIHHTGCAIVWSGEREDAERYWEQLDDAGLTMGPLEAG